MTEIIIYTNPSWPHCHTAKNFLRNNGYKFIEKDISKNPNFQKELIALGARGVPTFKIDEEIIVGFNKEKIISLIDYKIINCPNCSKKIRVPKNKGKIKITCHNCNKKFITKT